jgi:hypothetical protein
MLMTSVPAYKPRNQRDVLPLQRIVALRTAFLARFIILREGRRTRAHRTIENMTWRSDTTAEDLCERFRNAFIQNGDKMGSVDRDLDRAMSHAERSVDFFADQYLSRACLSFAEALADYRKSNELLFAEEGEDKPREGGWKK